jgi:hypothetical protein
MQDIHAITEILSKAYSIITIHPTTTPDTTTQQINQLPGDTSTTQTTHTQHLITQDNKFNPEPLPETDAKLTAASIHVLQTTSPPCTVKQIQIHLDGGANCSITNSIALLLNYKNIKNIICMGCDAGPALKCTEKGLLPWKAPTGEVLHVKCYYSDKAADTIVSPTNVVSNTINDFNTWTKHSNVDTGSGYVQFHRRNKAQPLTYPLYMKNGLWYSEGEGCTILDHSPQIWSLMMSAMYELYHQQLGHPGECTMQTIHHCMDDIPALKVNSFFN